MPQFAAQKGFFFGWLFFNALLAIRKSPRCLGQSLAPLVCLRTVRGKIRLGGGGLLGRHRHLHPSATQIGGFPRGVLGIVV